MTHLPVYVSDIHREMVSRHVQALREYARPGFAEACLLLGMSRRE